MKLRTFCVAALLGAVVPGIASAQQQRIPTVTITATDAKSAERFSVTATVHGFADGSAIVADGLIATRRMVRLDNSLGLARVILDSAAMNLGANSLIPYKGDSVIRVELSSQSLLVMDAAGNVARVMAPPKAMDIYLLSGMNASTGAAGIDALGRIVYRASYRLMPTPNAQGQMMRPPPPEKAPIVRGDFDTRRVDTIGEVSLAVMVKAPSIPVNMPLESVKVELNPMAAGDEWAMLADGTVAIVRTQDYHIDWIESDGTKRSSPKMPFEWRRVTDEEKKFKADSMTRWADSMIKLEMNRPLPPGVTRPQQPTFGIVSFDEMPSYHPPIRPGVVRADRDNNLWILPTTSTEAKDGLLYDVINRNGELYRRVQLPAGAVIAGFGKGGLVYLLQPAGDNRYVISRAKVELTTQ